MALTNSEVARIKAELGYNVLAVGAEPYIGITAMFDQVIQPYTTSGLATTSATPVTAASTPTPQSLTLGSVAGLAAGDVLVVDVDSRQERATIQSITGLSVTLQLSFAHSGTYPVIQEGGESIIREILRELARLGSGMGSKQSAISTLSSRAGIKKVDEVEFFGGGSSVGAQGLDPVTQILKLREYWRDELASVLGIPRMNVGKNSGGSEIGVY
jgi:hypothetical protein